MIDDSICYLIHDMLGYNYSSITVPDRTEPAYSRLYDRYRVAVTSSQRDLITFIRAVQIGPEFEAMAMQRLNDTLNVPALTPPEEMQSYCMCNNGHDQEDIAVFRWLSKMDLQFPGGTISIIGDAFDPFQLMAEEMRQGISPRSDRISTVLALLPPGSAMDSICEGTFNIWSSFITSRTVPENVITLGIYPNVLIVGRDNPSGENTVYTGNPSAEIMPGITVDHPCISEPGTITMDFSIIDIGTFFAMLGIELLTEQHISNTMNDSLWERYYDALHMQYNEIRREHYEATRNRGSRSRLEIEQLASLSNIRGHNEARCDICQERELFSERRASEAIRELVTA